jgi:hypothetical protein
MKEKVKATIEMKEGDDFPESDFTTKQLEKMFREYLLKKLQSGQL